MNVTIRAETEGLRRGFSFVLSASLHGAALAWIAMGAAFLAERPPSFYDQEIGPHRSQIVWYGVHNRLPNVKPAASRTRPKPPRAVHLFRQAIVAHAREDARPPQMILAAAPEIRLPKPLPLPNILAVTRPEKPLRRFVPPVEQKVTRTAALPEAPVVPVQAAVRHLAVNATPSAPPPLLFKPPDERRRTLATVLLPAGPEVAPAEVPAAAPRVLKGFTPPASDPPAATQPRLDPPLVAAAPEFAVPAPPEPSVAIVGLRPVEVPSVAPPPISHQAGFSAGPKPRKSGSDSDSKQAVLTASGLLVRGGPPDARATLMASLAPATSAQSLRESLHRARAEGLLNPAPVGAPRVNSAPDPRLAGRPVYVMAIQMPNITSYSGSWMVWFAARDPGDQPIEAPVPLHKVDPKYIASARDERVEGKVRLFAVIRKTGELDSVELLQRLDPRLDRSAIEALLKWRFEPARRQGVPVDVEAVFEIPFHLKPRENR